MTPSWDNLDPPRREPIFNMPGIVMGTAVALLLLYFVYRLLPDRLQIQMLLDFAFIPARFDGLPPEFAAYTNNSAGWGVLTMVTHAGLHGGLFHLIFNVAWLVAFGTIVARVAGWFGYLSLFALGAMAGAAAFWAVHPGEAVPVVGASGAISALMGAGARFFVGPPRSVPVPLTNIRLLGFTGGWLLINLIFGVSGFQVGGETGQIAWEAHMGGYFAGLLLIPFFVRRPRRA